MSTAGQFSTKNPTIKRILKEASELSTSPSPDYTAAPLESNLFEWHFTLRGPPAPSPFADGFYHGRIVLPPAYPLRPPSFRFLTPSGRFEANREICLSISGFHEETWQPAWGIRTALVAIRSFMDSDAGGQVGGMTANDEVRRRLARESRGWKCMAGCGGKTCEEIIREVEEECERVGADGKKNDETVPDELRLGFRDEMGKVGEADKTDKAREGETVAAAHGQDTPATRSTQDGAASPVAARQPQTQSARAEPSAAQVPSSATRMRTQTNATDTAGIDKAIIGVGAALLFMLFIKFL